ncbi:hypothetical protein [Acinetobacter sp. YH12025]|uniref:hypothetical protein n=1 Tax=Acinetobacter sp. YH12025 TaxID=2601042 RepID=UPI0015D20B33|nr:hypothetical protein [Acinetobacter sp. YH12025]
MEDYLGKAANEKQAAKIAIRERRFDDAWRHLSNQKILYLKHAHRERFSAMHTLVIDSSPHEDMANILRIEGKHGNALSNISYTYKAAYTANRPTITLERKLEAYYNRAYKNNKPFKRFLSLLKALPNSDFGSVKMFVEKFYPLAPDISDESTTLEKKVVENTGRRIVEQATKPQVLKNNYQGVIHIKPKENDLNDAKYPEPAYLKTSNIAQDASNGDGKILGYPTSDWVVGLVAGLVILVIFIWIIG